MDQRSAYLNELMLHAVQFVEQGDVYNAVKLLRRIIKTAPEWHEPHARLAELYKKQGEWKAMLHFAKRAVALHTADAAAWRNVGIAATALKKARIAQTVWNKFGISAGKDSPRSIIGLRIQIGKQLEIVWAHPLDPAKALITSIPHPASARRFHDVMLFDYSPCGYAVTGKQRYPVFDALGLLRHSPYKTFACQVDTTDKKVLRVLEKLCRQAGVGFENWTNAARAVPFQSEKALPEFYGADILPQGDKDSSIVALAALQQSDAEQVLHDWSIITLIGFSALERKL